MADDSRITFHGSPSGARAVEVTWITKDTGVFGRDSRVPRSQATHARVREWGGSNAGERVLTVGEADTYIRELRIQQEQDAATQAELTQRRNAWLATLCSSCPHCQTPRAYAGLEQLEEGSAGSVAVFGAWATSNVNVHVYQCTYCGSMELFRDGGPIEHPLAGNRPAEPA